MQSSWGIALAARPLWFILGGGLLAISLATLLTRMHPTLRTQTKVQQAVQSWIPVILLAAAGVLFGPAPSALVFTMVSWAVLREGLQLLPLSAAQRSTYLVLGTLLSAAGHVLVAIGSGAWSLLLPCGMTVLVLPVLHMLRYGTHEFLRVVGGLTLIYNAAITLLLFVSLMVSWEWRPHPLGAQGVGVFFFVQIIFSDAMQYVGGKWLGRHRLAPAISPGKTVEGLLFAAAVCAVLGTLLAPMLLGMTRGVGMLLAVTMTLLGVVGDLLVSCWKRDAGVKDTGTVLPGQGGVLDRCDSMIYVAPWFWVAVNVLF